MEGRPGHRMSKKLQLAFSERRIRKRIYRMYARFRPYHLIGAIGGFLTALTAIISLAVSLAPSGGSSLPSPPLLAWQFPHRTT